MIVKVLFLFVWEDKVEFVAVGLFGGISTPEKFQLDGGHDAYGPGIVLFIDSAEKMTEKLFVC